jgi:nicotinamide-nucleotide amidase
MPSSLVIESSKVLKSHHLTVAFAESATAGRLAAEFALTEDSGKILIGGLVCYDASVKEEILGIPVSFVEKYTPESAEVTKEMAERMRKFMQADVHVAVTGLTTSGGSETPQKPVGTMFIHLIMKDKSVGIREVFDGTPEAIIMQTVDKVAELLIMHIV